MQMPPPLAARKRTTWSAYPIVWLTMQNIAWGTARVFFRKCHYRSSTITVLHINYIVLAIQIQTLNALPWIPFGCNSNISTSSNEERDNSIDITNSLILFWQSKCKWHLAISYDHWQRRKYCKTRVNGLLCQGTRYEIRRRRRWSWCEEMREENRKRHNERQAKSNRIKLKWQCLCPETDTMCALCVSFSFTVIVIISHCECYGACLIVELAISYTLAHISQTDTQTNLRVTWIWMSERMRVSVWVSEFLIKILLLELLSDDRNDQTKERFVTCGAMRYTFTHFIQFILPQFTCIFLV